MLKVLVPNCFSDRSIKILTAEGWAQGRTLRREYHHDLGKTDGMQVVAEDKANRPCEI